MEHRQKRSPDFKGTKALVVVLGVHGGGVANVKWMLKYGAKVTVTDLRTKKELEHSIRQFSRDEKKRTTFVLGGQRTKDFKDNELIIAGPGVPRDSRFLNVAKKYHRRIENDASLFFRYINNPVIGVTGTRGKTTTTTWIAELMKKKYPHVRPSGNTPDNAFLKEFERVNNKNIPVVAELSSWQLEYLPASQRAPHVAVITNLFPDHLNRYEGSMREYADAKANIFAEQTADDVLILNYQNEWTKYFLKKKPVSRLLFMSTSMLPKKLNGIFVREGMIIERLSGKERALFSAKRFLLERGIHNLENLLLAMLAVYSFDPKQKIALRDTLDLSTPKMRQEIVAKKKDLTIVNDSCATSPDGTIAAIKRFVHPDQSVILIAGGTDKDLEFDQLARTIRQHIPSEQVILLEGSATTKLVRSLKNFTPYVENTLSASIQRAFGIAAKLKGNKVILFSPGAASFEKFLHEFDRGEKFNKLVRQNMVQRYTS